MGYIGQKRSERSQEAIENGLVTKSQLKAWQKRAVESGDVSPCEWHHTGKFYSKTYYYDLKDFQDLKASDFPPKKKQAEQTTEKWFVLVSASWGGTKKHRKIIGADIRVTNKINERQRTANKYFYYGGYIKEFASHEEALQFSKIAELER